MCGSLLLCIIWALAILDDTSIHWQICRVMTQKKPKKLIQNMAMEPCDSRLQNRAVE